MEKLQKLLKTIQKLFKINKKTPTKTKTNKTNEQTKKSFKLYLVRVTKFWLGDGETTGAASLRSCQKLPPFPRPRQSNYSKASEVTYLRREKDIAQIQLQRRVE